MTPFLFLFFALNKVRFEDMTFARFSKPV